MAETNRSSKLDKSGKGATGWTYNANGEALTIGTAINALDSLGLTWDGLGRISSVKAPGAQQAYTYDGDNLRVSLKDTADPKRDRYYAYGSGHVLLGEYDASKTLREVLYLGSEAIAEVDEKGIHDHPTKAKQREDRTELA